MGWPAGGGEGAETAAPARSGLHSWACLVKSAIFAGEGGARRERVPWKSPPMYSRTVAGGGAMGLGRCRLARGTRPLPLAIRIRSPFGTNRTQVGYQPAGMIPSDAPLPGRLTSKTATLLLSALATRSARPSGERARLLGVLPFGAFGWSALESDSRPRPVFVSRQTTRLLFAHATNSIAPSRVSAISVGWDSVVQVAATASEARSITATDARPQRLTKRRRPSPETRVTYGKLPAGSRTRRTGAFPASGRIVTVSPHVLAACSMRPSRLIERPPTTPLPPGVVTAISRCPDR